MTEAEWLVCRDGKAMLNKAPDGAVTERKARLFAAACGRRLWPQLGKAGRQLVEAAEIYADAVAGSTSATALLRRLGNKASAWNQRRRLESLRRQAEEEFGSDLVLWLLAEMEYGAPFYAYNITDDAQELGLSFADQAALVHHLLGNPFRSRPKPLQLPSSVAELATSLYGGSDCTFALMDALLEANHPELAEHFRQEPWHPKGCWVLDLILYGEYLPSLPSLPGAP